MKKKNNKAQEHQLLKKLEVEKLREKGIQCPSYNPLPKRKEELTEKEKEILKQLKKREYFRNNKPKKAFVGWEYKDRFTYRKIEK